MFDLFKPKTKKNSFGNTDFPYLKPNDLYFDNACQTLRPQVVIDAEVDYYQNFNACGGRVKYPWGQKTDQIIKETRQKILKFVGKNDSDYVVAFTLNTSYGMNLVLSQLIATNFNSITTTDIEHNSVFLPSIVWANKHQKPRNLLARNLDGTLDIDSKDPIYEKTVFIANTTSNIDGRELSNIAEVSQIVKAKKGLVLLDACQTLVHNCHLITNVDFNALFGSGHKMYGPSIGFVVIKKDLLEKGLNYDFIGGGTVGDVHQDSYELIGEPELYSRLEVGLQNFAGIVALNKTIDWLSKQDLSIETKMAENLFEGLKKIKNIELINQKPTTTATFYSPVLDGHQVGLYLAQNGIMTRTGYFCCHYYLKNKLGLPPLVRLSAGLNNSLEDVEKVLNTLETIFKHR